MNNSVSRPPITLTDEQLAAEETARRSTDNLMLRAFAGCAKSHTSEIMARRIRDPALSLQFNVKTAADSAKRMPVNFKVQTLNGLGFGAWLRGLPGDVHVLPPNPRKTGQLVTAIAKDQRMVLSTDQWENVMGLVRQAMLAGISPGDEGEPLVSDDPDNWLELLDGMGVFIEPDEFDMIHGLARQVLIEDIRLARLGQLSFDDQIYCPTVLGGKWPKYPVIFTDESQDFSQLNTVMIDKALRDDGRLVVVGDELQSIYAFRGATGNSMAQLQKVGQRRRSWQHLPLTMTFRCPKIVVERQQSHARGFRAFEANRPGEFRRFKPDAGFPLDSELPWSWGWSDLADIGTRVETSEGIKPSIAVLCRNNAPLLALAMRLLTQHVPVVMAGRDIGKSLIALAKKIAPDGATAIDVFVGLAEDWRANECALAAANGADEKLASINDRAGCLTAVATGPARDVNELRLVLTRLFARESGQLTLSSIHRAKGLEWDIVLVLDPWRIPSRWARDAAVRGNPLQLQQEMNLQYVGETRTRNVLLHADMEDFQ